MENSRYKLNPFLHLEDNEIYNPLEDTSIGPDSDEYKLLTSLYENSHRVTTQKIENQRLLKEGFLVPLTQDLSSNYLLKYVSIETHTVCNHKCYFCPVSIHTRNRHFMDMSLFEGIVHQLAKDFPGIHGVFLNGYNEPTLDHNLVAQLGLLHDLGISAALNSNGSGLPPAIVDEVLIKGALDYLCINLSTLNEEKFLADRQANHLTTILRNIDYIAKRKLAKEMHIVVLGKDDKEHDEAYNSIKDRFADTTFAVRRYKVNSRSGHVDVYQQQETARQHLRGCEQTGSRPLQHLHINAHGQCVLCCQDYHDQYIVGDLNIHTIDQVLAGPEMAQLRRWTYGIDNAPDDFICRKCSFAIGKS